MREKIMYISLNLIKFYSMKRHLNLFYTVELILLSDPPSLLDICTYEFKIIM